MKNMIIDFETFGTDETNCAVIDCSVIYFDWDRFTSGDPYTIREYTNVERFKLSVKEQVRLYGSVVDPDTVDFWNSQSTEVKRKITPKDSDLSVEDFVSGFLDSVTKQGKVQYWWSRGNAFDPAILKRLFKSQNKVAALEQHLKFWAVRDTRTHLDAQLDFPSDNGFVPIQNAELWNKVFKKHDSSWDVVADLLRLQTIARAELDLELL